MSRSLRNRKVALFKGPGKTRGVHVVLFHHTVRAKYISFQLLGRGYLQINGIRLNTYRHIGKVNSYVPYSLQLGSISIYHTRFTNGSGEVPPFKET